MPVFADISFDSDTLITLAAIIIIVIGAFWFWDRIRR